MIAREGDHGLVLAGHVARANPVWRSPASGEALAIFAGPQGYVSPSWYASKHDGGEVVPTWNYAVVHATGALSWIDDARWLRAFLVELTARHEAASERPWSLDDAPAAFIDQLLGTIVGCELRVTRLQGKLKLSQNRSAADREGVLRGLEARGDAASLGLAQLMRRQFGPLH